MPRHANRHRRAVNTLTAALDACRSVGVRSKSTLFQIEVPFFKLSRMGA